MVSLLDESTFKKISEILIDEYADITKTKSVEDYIREYEERLNLGTKAAYEEFVADCMTNMLTDTNAAETIVKLRNTMNEKAQNKFIKLINDTIRTLKSFVKRSNAIETASITSQLKSLQKISDLWAQGVSNAMTEFEKTENKGKSVENDKYSLKGINKDGIEVYETSPETMSLSWNERIKEYKRLLENDFKGRTARFNRNGHVYYAQFDEKSANKVLFGEKGMSAKGKKAIIKAGADGDIFDIVENATYKSSSEDTKNHKNKDGFTEYFDYFYKTVQIDGNVFDLLINVKKQYGTKEGYTYTIKVYDNNKIEASPTFADEQQSLVQGTPQSSNIISTNTGKSQEKFSLKTNVEETKDLIAVHNLTEANLLKSLELGGLPMPSIAIIKAKSSHSSYGDISLVFNKSTIDPEASKYNKVYGGDAWTPTYPAIEYKANEKVADKIHKLYYDLAKKYGYDEARPLYNLAQDLEDELNRRNGETGLIEYYKDDTSLMNLYLVESGKDKVQSVINEVRTEMSEAETEQSKYLIKALGKDIIDEFKVNNDENPLKHRKAYIEKNGEKIKEAYRQLMSEEYGFSDEQISNVMNQTRMFDYIKMIKTAYNYLHGNTVSVKTETDRAATDRAIKKAAGDGYTKWLNDLLNGAEEKSGIRNNVDYFTPMGNRRSFEALHWENNLENVVKAMREESATGNASLFSGLGIWGVSAKKYNSIEEIKSDKNRLSQMDEEEYSKIKQNFGERLHEIATAIMDKTERNQFIAMDNAQECIVDAVRSSKTKSGILKNLKQYQQLNVTEADVDDIVKLVGEISNMPTEYFEAKPQRAVGFNEVATAIIPNNSSEELKTALDEKGVVYREYEAGNEEARTQVLNSLEDVKFSEKLTNVVDSDGKKLSESQAEFFKDSKVRDEDGNLLKVYHGTNSDFTVFNRGEKNGQLGKGIYFAADKSYAKENGKKIVSAYLNVENPFTVTDNTNILTAINEKFPGTDYIEMTKVLAANGYDGIIYDHWDNGKIIVAFEPNQIKLTDNLTPTNDEDIRYSEKISTDGEKYVDVDEALYDNTDGESVARVISNIISSKFNNLISVNNQKIRINATTKREWTMSESAQYLMKYNPQKYNDKLKAIVNADEILKVANNWIGEEKKHIRKDNIVEFARGNINYKVGENGYCADVLVGIKADHSAVLYDIKNIYNKKITEDTLASQVTDSNRPRSEVSSVEDTLSQSAENVNNKFSQKINISDIESIKSKYQDELQTFIVTERDDDITLKNIVVKPEYRNKGIGQDVLDELISYADNNSKIIRLTPTSEYGTKSRLINWYKNNGFVENKGKNADLRTYETMYRLPENKTTLFSEKLPAASYEKVIKSLEKDNAALREDVNDLKELVKVQGKVTHGEVFTKTSVEAVAKKLARDFGMRGEKTELVKMLNEYYSSIASSASDSNLNFTDVMENALPIAQYINENIPEKNVLDDQAQAILDYLKTSKISSCKKRKHPRAIGIPRVFTGEYQ